MASSLALRTVVLVAASALVLVRPAHASAQAALRLTVLVVGEDEWQALAERRPVEPGLGVYPDSRDPMRFVEEIGRGAPSGESTSAAPRISLAQVLADAGVRVRVDGAAGEEFERVFKTTGSPGFNRISEAVLTVRGPPLFGGDAGAIIDQDPQPFLILGFSRQTPVWVGRCLSPCAEGGSRDSLGVLDGGIARRPGIVTPYDFATTVLEMLDVPIPEGFIGRPLGGDVFEEPLATVRWLASRLENDAHSAPGLAAVTVTLGIGSIIVGLSLRRFGRASAAMRAAQAAVLVLPGWAIAIFIQSSRWEIRSIPVVIAALLGAALTPRIPAQMMARIGFGSAVAFAALVAIAPNGFTLQPGLQIWGNPLVSWRFFGLQNVEAAILASGVVVWGVLAGVRPVVLAIVAAITALIIGAPAVGANFVGVLTFLFGATMAVLFLWRRRAETWQILLSGAIAVGGFALALLADAGSPVSHGGRAARSIASGGWSAAWDIIERRLRLNTELIRDFGGGPLWVFGLVATSIALIVWATRSAEAPLRGRVAVLGGTLMALASLVLEDSGFYSGAVLWFVAADAWLLITLSERSRVTPPGIAAPPGAAV